MVFLSLFMASCAGACLLIAALRRSSRLFVHLFEDQPAGKTSAIAGPQTLSLVSNTRNPER
jgi:hypothetical protein